jgi:hypothetical protein
MNRGWNPGNGKIFLFSKNVQIGYGTYIASYSKGKKVLTMG